MREAVDVMSRMRSLQGQMTGAFKRIKRNEEEIEALKQAVEKMSSMWNYMKEKEKDDVSDWT